LLETLLRRDTAIQKSGPAAKIGREAVEERAAGSISIINTALDKAFGTIDGGKTAARKRIRDTTASARNEAYEAAYSTPIDYSTGKGRRIESLLKRVPQAAIDRANELMAVQGKNSLQIIAKVADDGSVSYSSMPDVRQIDYITRGLNDVVELNDGAGKLAGQTQKGIAYSNLSTALRTATKKAVPAYKKALDTSADAIGRSKAIEDGYSLLTAKVRPDEVALSLRGKSKAEKAAIGEGIRNYIEDTVANVGEALKAVKDMSSRASRKKMAMVLGDKKSKALFNDLDRATIALELRAQVSTNSRTFGRQQVQKMVDDATTPGAIGEIAQGAPINAVKRIVQSMTSMRPDDIAARQDGIYAEIAEMLVGASGPRANAALKMLKGVNANEPISASKARFISKTTVGLLAVPAYQKATQSSPIQ